MFTQRRPSAAPAFTHRFQRLDAAVYADAELPGVAFYYTGEENGIGAKKIVVDLPARPGYQAAGPADRAVLWIGRHFLEEAGLTAELL